MADTQANEPTRGDAADGSWMSWTATALAGIWVAVVLISVFAPDFVSGSEQEHMPIAAFTTWIWGVVATGGLLWLMGRLRGSAARRPIWMGLSIATIVVWLVATILSLTLPVVETGSDPTRLPFGAMFAPVAAAMLTLSPASSLRSFPARRPPGNDPDRRERLPSECRDSHMIFPRGGLGSARPV